MTKTFEYRRGQELPGITLLWEEQLTGGSSPTWGNLDLSSGYTFSLTLVDADGTDVVTKSSGLTGADGSVAIAWAVDDLDISPGIYDLKVRCRETATSKDRDFSPGEPYRVVITT